MLGLKTDQEVLGELVRVKVPAVWQAMTEHNVMWTLVVSRWFICLFIDVLPVEVSDCSPEQDTNHLDWLLRTYGFKVIPHQRAAVTAQIFFCSLPDGAADMGLPLLWGLQDHLPGGTHPHQAQRGVHPAGTELPRYLRPLQTNHQGGLGGGLPRLYAGGRRGRGPQATPTSPSTCLSEWISIHRGSPPLFGIFWITWLSWQHNGSVVSLTPLGPGFDSPPLCNVYGACSPHIFMGFPLGYPGLHGYLSSSFPLW